MAEVRTCKQFPELHLHTPPGSGIFLSALNTRRAVNLPAPNPSSPILPTIPRCQLPAQPQGSILPSVYLHSAMAGVNQALNPLQNFLSFQLKFWQRLKPQPYLEQSAPWQQGTSLLCNLMMLELALQTVKQRGRDVLLTGFLPAALGVSPVLLPRVAQGHEPPRLPRQQQLKFKVHL